MVFTAVGPTNPFAAPACPILGRKVHAYACKLLFSGPVTNLLSMLCILMPIFLHGRAEKGKKSQDLTFHTFLVIHFSSDGMASVAVKWLGQNAWADQNFGLRDICLKRVLKTNLCAFRFRSAWRNCTVPSRSYLSWYFGTWVGFPNGVLSLGLHCLREHFVCV